MATFVAIYGSLMLVALVAAGILAYLRGRDVSYWMTLSFLFPPFIILLFLMPKQTGPRPRREGLEAQEDRELARDGSDRMF
jgi:ABC-type Fe3+-siderophore transport system permease subunit